MCYLLFSILRKSEVHKNASFDIASRIKLMLWYRSHFLFFEHRCLNGGKVNVSKEAWKKQENQRSRKIAYTAKKVLSMPSALSVCRYGVR
jgi:hypothetical protein